MHYRPEDLPILGPGGGEGGGCLRSIKAGEMEIGATWTTGPADYTHVYAGLPGGVCPCEHYGYIFSGRIRARYEDGSEEVIGPGEIYWIPKGHVLIYEEATHHLEINPHRELRQLMEAVTRNSVAVEPIADRMIANGENDGHQSLSTTGREPAAVMPAGALDAQTVGEV